MNREKPTVVNRIQFSLPSLSVNEGVCRSLVGVFCATLDPTIEELADIKCAVSEAVTNCIVHAYRGTQGIIYISASADSERTVRITVRDRGCGIADIKQARMPLFTTDAAGERSGMGFSVMETFTDHVTVRSRVGVGTTVSLKKRLS